MIKKQILGKDLICFKEDVFLNTFGDVTGIVMFNDIQRMVESKCFFLISRCNKSLILNDFFY